MDKRIERVTEMEKRFDSMMDEMERFSEDINRFLDVVDDDLEALSKYVDSGKWQKDFEADEAGLIPADVKRGILSEDAYTDLMDSFVDLMEEVQTLQLRMLDFCY